MSSLQDQLIKKGLATEQSVKKDVSGKDVSGYVKERGKKRSFLHQFNKSRLEKHFQYAQWIYKDDYSKVTCMCALCGKSVDTPIHNTGGIKTDEQLDFILRSGKSRGHILSKLVDVDSNRVIRIAITGYEELSCVLACVECMTWHMSNKKFFIKPSRINEAGSEHQ